MEEQKFLLITFESINYASMAESCFKKNGMVYQVMPTPREITASCGLSIRTVVDNINKTKEFVDKKEVRAKGLYISEIKCGKRVFEKID